MMRGVFAEREHNSGESRKPTIPTDEICALKTSNPNAGTK